MQFSKSVLFTAMLASMGLGSSAIAGSSTSTTTKEITLIQMGDVHGHLMPRPNVRSDSVGRMEGGLARMKTKIDKIRSENRNNLLFNTGDTT